MQGCLVKPRFNTHFCAWWENIHDVVWQGVEAHPSFLLSIHARSHGGAKCDEQSAALSRVYYL